MSNIAILMFITLSIALAIGIWQVSKMDKKLPDDTSDIKPERRLQKMDQVRDDRSVRGTKKNPRAA